MKKFIVHIHQIALVILLWAFHSPMLLAQNNADSTLQLWPDGVPSAVAQTDLDKPKISVFLPNSKSNVKTGVVIFPGGGYAQLAMEKEGYKVAKWFNSLGIAAFVVQYRLGMRYQHPAQIMDAQKALASVRQKADSWGINLENLGVMGFSAGGHLASTAGTHFNHPYIEIENKDVLRPDFMILIYPVITMKDDYTHRGSRTHLLGDEADSNLITRLSNELQVNANTPPVFLIHGTDDSAVPVENSLEFYNALLDYNVPAEMHLFEHGPHGFGLAFDDPVLSTWTDLCRNWLKSKGF